MNKRFFIWALLACVTFSLTSCGEDDDKDIEFYTQADMTNLKYYVDIASKNTVRVGTEHYNIDKLINDVMQNGENNMPSGYEQVLTSPESDETNYYIYGSFPTVEQYSLADLDGLWFPLRIVDEDDMETLIIFYVYKDYMCSYAFFRKDNRWYNMNGDACGDGEGVTLLASTRIDVKDNNGFYFEFNDNILELHLAYADKDTHTVLFAEHHVDDISDEDLKEGGISLDAPYAHDFWAVYTQY